MIDLTHAPAATREAEARRLATEQALEPFDLAHGPLLRAVVLRLAEDEHVVVLTLHHIVADGWSLGILITEIQALYTAAVMGETAQLADLPIQYADYAVWQRAWLQGEVLDKQLAYWKERLGGRLPILELPTDRPRPAVQGYRGATEQFTLTRELTDSL